MAFRLPGKVPFWSKQAELQKARAVFGQEAPVQLEDRRYESRCPVSERRRMRMSSVGGLVNLSRSGFAIQVSDKCLFARGESHRLLLQIGNGSIDVEGKVCWTKSLWDGAAASSSDTEFRQIAGFELPDGLPAETELVLNMMRNIIQHESVPVDVKEIEITRRCTSNGG